ncbi:hypothetical protein [Mixta hanseatica]|uniref:Uncharacterized protein n=1 Tax=Mixta hanseatica TaxID=2872648 RepID=A0ABY4RBH9_9GAMM|nr:hypothetical protein [Mixta hanseatica]UQY44807.1 hypothetical protein K6958_03715 [Mixta hanseatica]
MPFTPYFVNGFVQISAVLQTTLGYVIDGARFYQFPRAEYSISQEKKRDPRRQALTAEKSPPESGKGALTG